jgi:hypothetical protein
VIAVCFAASAYVLISWAVSPKYPRPEGEVKGVPAVCSDTPCRYQEAAFVPPSPDNGVWPKACPKCQKNTFVEAIVCPHCQKLTPAPKVEGEVESITAPPAKPIKCIQCGRTIDLTPPSPGAQAETDKK